MPGSRIKTPGRYDSLQLISWWQQSHVAKARVMVVGAGALGNEILKNLALLGIGHIFIIDFDDIEASNLTRSVLYRESDIGHHKAEIAAKRIKEINPDIKVAFRHGNACTDIGLGLVKFMDVVIAAVDN
ncbi:MAG: ThiF family adenylyltransferase, partial [Chloroflexi bacterium]|nr:ThiF family adenylyltransferase [Chloroflexota bacterium]